jgi:hypothetical protein
MSKGELSKRESDLFYRSTHPYFAAAAFSLVQVLLGGFTIKPFLMTLAATRTVLT